MIRTTQRRSESDNDDEYDNDYPSDEEELYKGIPISEIYSYLNTMPQEMPVISVGSGNGVLEYKLQELGIKNIICVDPDPESYDKYPENNNCIKPSYDVVENLLKDKPELVEQCVLLLGWPSPNESTFDYEAVMALNPYGIVLVYETLGGAGGDKLHTWLNEPEGYQNPCDYTVVYNGGGFVGKTNQCKLLIKKLPEQFLLRSKKVSRQDNSQCCIQ
jgi:hypothetical protein